jgi:hypothetical protein
MARQDRDSTIRPKWGNINPLQRFEGFWNDQQLHKLLGNS